MRASRALVRGVLWCGSSVRLGPCDMQGQGPSALKSKTLQARRLGVLRQSKYSSFLICFDFFMQNGTSPASHAQKELKHAYSIRQTEFSLGETFKWLNAGKLRLMNQFWLEGEEVYLWDLFTSSQTTKISFSSSQTKRFDGRGQKETHLFPIDRFLFYVRWMAVPVFKDSVARQRTYLSMADK